jgi:AcrR family transcriptional regulator
MARPKAFDVDQALDAAIDVFRQHGFDGTSAEMLVSAMGIGRQSLYDTFGDKWGLYCAAVRRYCDAETLAHGSALRSGARPIDGVRAMVERVVAEAARPCLGVGSICEFGRTRADLAGIHAAADRVLHATIARRLAEAQQAGEIASGVDPDIAAGFLMASFSGIRIAARGGASDEQLSGQGALALRALQ